MSETRKPEPLNPNVYLRSDAELREDAATQNARQSLRVTDAALRRADAALRRLERRQPKQPSTR